MCALFGANIKNEVHAESKQKTSYYYNKVSGKLTYFVFVFEINILKTYMLAMRFINVEELMATKYLYY